MSPCIYPGPHGEMSPEHYLPAALGTFEGYEPLQDRVCAPCNTHIGNQAEIQFLRAGQVAFFRWLLGIEGRDGLLPSPFRKGAAGVPPITMLGRLPGIDFPLLLEVDPGSENVYPLRQIIFDGGVAGIHPIAITDRMQKDPEILRQYLAAQGLETARPVEAFGPTEEIEWLTELMRTFGGTPSKSSVMDSGGPQKIQVVAIVRATDAHFRAVAKIGFHYALKMFPDLTGLEHEFGPIKDFIWNGGDVDRFVGQRGDQFVENFRRGARPTHWMHILAVVRTYERITAYAQFFAGPRSLPPGYEIDLGRDPARIRRPTERRAHQFVILDPNASIGIVGRMEDGNPANSIWVPT